MKLDRLRAGEEIAAVSPILLFVSMFFHWFGVEAYNTSNLLFAIESVEPGKNAWEALKYIPIAVLTTIVITLAATMLRLAGAVPNPSIPANAAVAILGLISTLLILFRIVDPPVFGVEPTITYEGVVQWPIFLALAAAAGIAFGGWWAMREVGGAIAHLRRRRDRDQG